MEVTGASRGNTTALFDHKQPQRAKWVEQTLTLHNRKHRVHSHQDVKKKQKSCQGIRIPSPLNFSAEGPASRAEDQRWAWAAVPLRRCKRCQCS
ncbi:hypothetical protein Y1Q_0011809 [Alligator mississippiensis]|uniref:Uncharacterized protein n=1 Tax=Alligator mississippiensis TaxID=8496 RepID=A0A151M1A5_ALLMI|nr:hypothetical protein Y1Q_0011809 [Alligator mississippiensis]